MPTKRDKNQVIAEIQRRAATGRSLKSGKNRSDWLYPAAVYHCGSWGNAVEAAGFSYAEVKGRPLLKTEVRRELRRLVGSGEPVLAKDHPDLHKAALRHFGGWRVALAAVGAKDPHATRWTKGNVIAAILDDLQQGLPVTSNQMRRRNENLYMAGRRRFRTWAASLQAARRRAKALESRVEPTAGG